MNSLRGLLGIMRMDKFPFAWIRELWGVTNSVDERSDEGVLRWFVHVKRLENGRIPKRVLVVVQWAGRERDGFKS